MNEKEDASRYLMISLLVLCTIITTGVFASLGIGDMAILSWTLTGLVVAASFARPFSGAGTVATVMAIIIFFGAQVYRMVMATGAGLELSLTALESDYFPAAPNYLPLAFLGALSFAVVGWLSDGVVRQLTRTQAQLLQTAAVIQELTLHDDLTGTLKRVYAEKVLSEEIGRSRRYNRAVSVVLLSADDWAEVNRDRGEDRAQQALKQVGRLLRENLRVVDTVSRYDGARFVAILPETERAGAQVLAERLCRSVSDRVSIQFRAGVAEFPSDATSKSELMSEVDAALRFARNADITVASHGLLAS